LVANVPHGHWKTLTLVAALRIDGLTAPYVIDGAMDGPSFLAYVEQVLVTTLQKGDTVFMDNLRTHKIDGVAQAIKAVGAKPRYLPAYSPDLNPIEQAFSKLKAALRKGAARTVTALLKLIGRLVKTFVPDEPTTFDMPDMGGDPHQVENEKYRFTDERDDGEADVTAKRPILTGLNEIGAASYRSNA
jgi:transposase